MPNIWHLTHQTLIFMLYEMFQISKFFATCYNTIPYMKPHCSMLLIFFIICLFTPSLISSLSSSLSVSSLSVVPAQDLSHLCLRSLTASPRRQPPQPSPPTSTSLVANLPYQVSHFFSLCHSLSLPSPLCSRSLIASPHCQPPNPSPPTFRSLNQVVGVRFGMSFDVWVLGH